VLSKAGQPAPCRANCGSVDSSLQEAVRAQTFIGDGGLDLESGCNEPVIEHDLEWKALANVRPRNAKMSRINSFGSQMCPRLPGYS
jgi:hypothetical protein